MSDQFNSKELLIDGVNKLQLHKIPTPEVDARILLSYAINCKDTIIFTIIYRYQKRKKKFYEFLDKRIQGNQSQKLLVLEIFGKIIF